MSDEQSDTQNLRKWTHTFVNVEEHETPPRFPSTFAAVHGLATMDVIVSCRGRTGNPKQVRTTVQDPNIVLVFSRSDGDATGSGGFEEGDTIIVMG
jgi:hypothetical protein